MLNACSGSKKSDKPATLEALAAALANLSPADRAKLVAMLSADSKADEDTH